MEASRWRGVATTWRPELAGWLACPVQHSLLPNAEAVITPEASRATRGALPREETEHREQVNLYPAEAIQPAKSPEPQCLQSLSLNGLTSLCLAKCQNDAVALMLRRGSQQRHKIMPAGIRLDAVPS